MKSLFKTVALITFFSFLTRVAGFLFRIVLSRIVGAEGLGVYQVASSIFIVLLTVISSGIPLIISRTSANFLVKKEKGEGSFVNVSLVFTLIISIILSIIVIIFKDAFALLFTNKEYVYILIAFLPGLVFSSIYCVLRGVMWGKSNYFALCITEFYEQIVRILLALLMIDITFSAFKNALNLALSMSIACVFSMILTILLYFYYGGKIGKIKRGYLKPLVKQSLPITFMRVASSFIQPVVAIIIPLRLIGLGFTNSQALSLYGVAVGMTMPLLFVPTMIIGSLSTALIPDISTALAQNDKNHIEKRIDSSLFFALFISSLFIPFFLGAGEQIGQFLYDDILSGTLLQSSSWVLLPLGLTNISSGILNSLGLEKKSFINFVIGSVAMLLSLWFLPSLLGINALLWGLGINYLIISVLNLMMLRKSAKIKLNILKPVLKILLITLPCSALTSFVSSLAGLVFPLFISLALSGFVSVSSFILLSGVAGLIDIKVLLISVKDKIKSRMPKLKGRKLRKV